jgi:molybdate transport system substrate-binding protein
MPLDRSRLYRRGLAAFAGLALGLAATVASAAEPLVFAAASLKNALDEIAEAYKSESSQAVVISYAASSALARQIEEAAPADIFISADLQWMDYLAEMQLINETSRVTLLGNRLVLVAPRDSTVALEIGPAMKLVEALGPDGKLAMAGVEAVPAGRYGKAALTHYNLWDAVQPRVVESDNVRGALAFVATGEAPLGIVYATDAAAEPKVKVVGTFPEDSHPPVVYPAALLANAPNPTESDAFFTYVIGAKAQAIFEKHGFTVFGPDKPRS